MSGQHIYAGEEDLPPYVSARPKASGKPRKFTGGFTRKLKPVKRMARSVSVWKQSDGKAFAIELVFGPDTHRIVLSKEAMEALVDLHTEVTGGPKLLRYVLRIAEKGAAGDWKAVTSDDVKGAT